MLLEELGVVVQARVKVQFGAGGLVSFVVVHPVSGRKYVVWVVDIGWCARREKRSTTTASRGVDFFVEGREVVNVRSGASVSRVSSSGTECECSPG